MPIYNYDNSTGEYSGPLTADESPLEPGVLLVPAHATTVQPPEAVAGCVRVWCGDAWSQVEDHRGSSGFVSGIATTITTLGPLPEGWSATAPAPTAKELAATIRAQRAVLLAACDWTQLADSPVSAEAKTAWATYRQALRDITAQAGFPTSVTWPTEAGA